MPQTVLFVFKDQSCHGTNHTLSTLSDLLKQSLRSNKQRLLVLVEGVKLFAYNPSGVLKNEVVLANELIDVYSAAQAAPGIVAVALDKQIVLVDLKTGRVDKTLPTVESSILSLLVLRNGFILGGGNSGGVTVVSPVPNHKLLRNIHFDSFKSSAIYQLVELPDGRIACGGFDLPCVIFNYETEQIHVTLERQIRDYITAMCFIKENTIAYGGCAGKIALYNIKEDKHTSIENSSEDVCQLKQMSNGTLVARYRKTGLAIWNMATKQQQFWVRLDIDSDDWFGSSLVDIDNSTFACRTGKGISIIDKNSGEEVRTIKKRTGVENKTRALVSVFM